MISDWIKRPRKSNTNSDYYEVKKRCLNDEEPIYETTKSMQNKESCITAAGVLTESSAHDLDHFSSDDENRAPRKRRRLRKVSDARESTFWLVQAFLILNYKRLSKLRDRIYSMFLDVIVFLSLTPMSMIVPKEVAFLYQMSRLQILHVLHMSQVALSLLLY